MDSKMLPRGFQYDILLSFTNFVYIMGEYIGLAIARIPECL